MTSSVSVRGTTFDLGHLHEMRSSAPPSLTKLLLKQISIRKKAFSGLLSSFSDEEMLSGSDKLPTSYKLAAVPRFGHRSSCLFIINSLGPTLSPSKNGSDWIFSRWIRERSGLKSQWSSCLGRIPLHLQIISIRTGKDRWTFVHKSTPRNFNVVAVVRTNNRGDKECLQESFCLCNTVFLLTIRSYHRFTVQI